MIGIDTNVLVRYITQDDKKQAEMVNDLFEKKLSSDQPGFISFVVLVEMVWVLEGCYKQPKNEIIRVISKLLSVKQLMIENKNTADKALKLYRSCSADFSDAVIYVLSCEKGCSSVVTFDKKAMHLGMVRPQDGV